MAQQQLLLIVAAITVIGVAVVVGVQMFADQSASANLDGVLSDMLHLSARTHQYYTKPTTMGGGSHSFVGLTADAAGLAKLTGRNATDHGTYSIATAGTGTQVVLQGDGVEDGDGDGTNVLVRLWVRADVADDSVVIVSR